VQASLRVPYALNCDWGSVRVLSVSDSQFTNLISSFNLIMNIHFDSHFSIIENLVERTIFFQKGYDFLKYSVLSSRLDQSSSLLHYFMGFSIN